MSFQESLSRLRFLLSGKSTGVAKDDLNDELQFHLGQATQARITAGEDAREARRRALIDFGGVERAREETYRQRPGWFLETVVQDLRYAFRGFRRNLGFTITVIATLALGIGATTAVFSVVDRILFRQLPYAQDDRLVSVGLVQSLERQEFTVGGFFFDWRDKQKPFEAFASQGAGPHACALVETNPAQVNCIYAQTGFLPLLGITPVLGRNFLPEEDRPKGPSVALISYGLWTNHYSRDPGIVGRLIDVDGAQVRVVGVLPSGFELPTLQEADVMLPMALDEGAERRASPGSPMRTFARLRPGVSLVQARAEMDPLFIHTRETVIPAQIAKDFHLSIRSLRDRETKDVQVTAWVLLGSVLAVLMIACANVSGLMIARGEARERELAVRAALGASRARLVRFALTESGLLSCAGAVLGLVLAEGLLRVFLALAPGGIPFLSRATLDLRIALFTMLLAPVCGLIFGLPAALQTPCAVAVGVRGARSRKRAWLRRGLVAGQIAVSVVLLAGAMLLLRSFRNLETEALGMRTGGVFTARIALPTSRYSTGQKKMEFYLQAESALRRLPGIGAVGFSDSVPPGGWHDDERFADLAAEGKPPTPKGSGGSVVCRGVTPEYFRALNIPLVRGRNFTETDRNASETLVVLSKLLAERMFPGDDATGKRVQRVRDGLWFTVVGVAENVKNGGLLEQDVPEIYFLRRNVQQDWGGRSTVGEVMSGAAPLMVVESELAPQLVGNWVRSQVAAIDPTVPVEIVTLESQVSKLADRPRFETALLSFFAFCGMLMAVIGLYGVISFMAQRRTLEIGVRMALGAGRGDILRLIAGEGLGLIGLGGALGLGIAFGVTRVLRSLLIGVGTHDPAAFAGVALLLGAVSLVATLVPARAAMRVDPVVALRCE